MRKLLIVVLAATACSPSGSPATTVPDPQGTTTVTTSPPAPSITVPAPTTTTTLAPRPELSTPQVVYFLLDAPVGAPTLVPVWRDATHPQGLDGAIETLLAGPTPTERLGVPAISTDVPPDALLLSAELVNGLATIDLTAAFYSGGSAQAARMAQVVYTATRLDDVESVAFRIDGEPYADLPGPTARIAFRELQGVILVEEPAYGGPAAQPGRLRGETRTASDELAVTITQQEGVLVAERTLDTSEAGWVPFDIPLPYSVTVDQPGELRLTTADGVVDMTYPVQLLLPPAGVCSAVGLSPAPVPQDLPATVAATRRAIIEAATSCDLDALAALGSPQFTFSFGGGFDAAAFWRDEEAAGIPVTRLMVQLLNTPPVLDPEFIVPTYLWPSAFRAAPTGEDFDLLEGIIDADDLALYRDFNEYLDLRIGIDTNGSWDFAVAGD